LFYPEEYYPAVPPSPSYYRRHIERYQKEKVKKLRTVIPRGKILDVGCGVGYFVKQALLAGYDAYGIELSRAAVTFGRQHLNLNLFLGNFLTFPFPEGDYDAVTLWHTFEHLPEPRLVLRRIHELLKSGGFVLIALPNISSLQAKLFKLHWYHLDVPRHLFHFSPASLTNLLQRSGFNVLRIDHYSKEHNGAGILGSLMRISPPDETFIHRVFRKTLGIGIANTLAWIESTLYEGGTFTLFAVKTSPAQSA